MIRISSGTFRNTKLNSPKTGIKPTSELVRQAVINFIRYKEKKDKMLDLFSGTGAVGLESISNGVSSCDFVEKNPQTVHFLNQNINKLLSNHNYHLFKTNAFTFANHYIDNRYDIIFADPFYKDLNAYLPDFINANCNLLEKDGIFILEHGKINFPLEKHPFFDKQKRYGDTYLSFFSKEDKNE